ncbi:Phenylalanyl-tRNA synthetase, beta subunit, cytoplasmic [Dimargaris cristalligena]|uniref:phenylalanine--tRNA ligase n=1 Tax=Dimargaris cristalligena TaxID=215637 RepID=A0A4P9ZUP7_9FUNG|nr:Phenylalanyl-tRNA synthetase, beta subunit, cytoplasmic [Dimargaris cristalligena]RKP36621.1 tRNA synthetases class II core domain (F)-domain-containing protein [Dimargaris cristalligena]|eukprot:RKP36621.1 tRNA synthetases class II core domain (F)-domain-containing protein [Dimargaris cristalligena]
MASTDLISHLLQTLDLNGSIDDTQTLRLPGQTDQPLDQTTIRGALSSLQSRLMVDFAPLEREVLQLTPEGQAMADTGSHEAKVFHAVPAGPEGILVKDLQAQLGASAKIGQGKALAQKWLKFADGRLTRLVDTIVDQTQADLRTIQRTGTLAQPAAVKDLLKRKLCTKHKTVSYRVAKGPQFALSVTKQATDITAELLASGEWKNQSFKSYNFNAVGIQPPSGHLHPLMKVREEFRSIFFEMGFTEMPTNKFVESSFWNFDALFQPQQHPARDLQDTFFLKDPVSSADLPSDLVAKVGQVHAEGNYGSIGYRYPWARAEAEKLLLRTHTTAVSSYMLHLLAQQKPFRPAKYFSIDRVFRNETLDATHLAEFHQVEGVIADRNVTLGDLIGFMDVFFRKMGITNLRYKPAYNPYTEPSLEIFSYHEGFKKWVEIGNSGMFRPEMCRPLGLDPDVRVIAWGLSLERPTMIKYGVDNIRELMGHKVDLGMIQNNPICRLDKKMGKEVMEETRA